MRPIFIALLVSGCLACHREVAKRAPVKQIRAGEAAVRTAREAAEKFPRPSDRADYLALRKSLVHARLFLRGSMAEVAEVIYGPIRSISEGGGALAALDLFMTQQDQPRSHAALEKIQTALRLAEAMQGAPLPSSRLAQLLSDLAYDVALTALGAEPGSPAELDAVATDTLGGLAAIREGLAELGRMHGASASIGQLQRRIEQLEKLVGDPAQPNVLSDPLTFVMQAGELGRDLRAWFGAVGITVRLPYQLRPARDSADVITPLHLPSLYSDLRPELIALGEKLFFDTSLSKNHVRSCASCHQPERAFTDGLAVPASLVAGHALKRNTPTLLYAALQATQMWDGRILGLRGQALGVIHTPEEMGLLHGTLASTVAARPDYVKQFTALFPDGINDENVGRALAAFEAGKLVPGSAPIDRFAAGDASALSSTDREGFAIFVRQGRCMRCHIPPLFGGTRPTDFAVPVFSVVGVPDRVHGKKLDADVGRGAITGLPLDQHAFKTPTLRNIVRTAPYFHHGRFATLEQVIDFYDLGGGEGGGIKMENQDPDIRPLHLTPHQRRQLLHFLRETLQDVK